MTHHRPNVQTHDELPPCSDIAEQAVLGCVLLDPERAGECLKQIEERFGSDKAFYDLKHQRILDAMFSLRREDKGIDAATVMQRLRDWNELDQIGGLTYLAELPNQAMSSANLPTYLATVWEKFLARQAIAMGDSIKAMAVTHNGINEPIIARISEYHEQFIKKTHQGNVTPQYLKLPSELGEDFFTQFGFFGGRSGPPGFELPIPFVLKIRFGEMTLVSGDDGSGKSTLLNYFALHLAHQLEPGQKIIVASMEMPPAVTLWMLAAQLLGSKHLPDSMEGQQRASSALAWLNQKFIFYDFLGIADWRDLLLAYRYAAERLGGVMAITDSAMRIGIPDDDYAQQGMAAAAFAQWAKDYKAHHFLVIHENKSDASGKAKVRGSKLWTANVDNVLQVKRNEKKGEEVGKIEWRIKNEKFQKHPNHDAIAADEAELVKKKQEWDSQMVLRKQRFPGTPQNASKFFWFDPESFQFRSHWQDPSVNWYQRWKKPKQTEERP